MRCRPSALLPAVLLLGCTDTSRLPTDQEPTRPTLDAKLSLPSARDPNVVAISCPSFFISSSPQGHFNFKKSTAQEWQDIVECLGHDDPSLDFVALTEVMHGPPSLATSLDVLIEPGIHQYVIFDPETTNPLPGVPAGWTPYLETVGHKTGGSFGLFARPPQ
jgi:hypothetical protein